MATITASGLASGVLVGTTSITALQGAITSPTATLTVTEPPPPPPGPTIEVDRLEHKPPEMRLEGINATGLVEVRGSAGNVLAFTTADADGSFKIREDITPPGDCLVTVVDVGSGSFVIEPLPNCP